MRITLTQVFLRKGKIGRTINEHELARAIDKVLADPAARRELRAKLNPDRPADDDEGGPARVQHGPHRRPRPS